MTDLHVYRHHCWACQLNRCPHEPHDWADGDDIDAAALIGRPDPTGEPCPCPCTTQPGPDRTHTTTSPVVPCTKETL